MFTDKQLSYLLFSFECCVHAVVSKLLALCHRDTTLLFSFECCIRSAYRRYDFESAFIILLFSFECCVSAGGPLLTESASRWDLLFSFECCLEAALGGEG